MKNGLSFLLKQIFDYLIPERVFVVALIVTTICFFINTILIICKNGYALRKRLWYFCLFFGLMAILVSCSLYHNQGRFFAICLFGINLLYFLPMFISGRERQIKKEEKQLIKFIDSKIRLSKNGDEDLFRNNLGREVVDDVKFMPTNKKQNDQTVTKIYAKPQENTVEESDLPDFSHVKNIIDRLEYFSLSATDRKQVNDLELVINKTENGENSVELKNKVNDGLGALLKIMSKYGV